MAKGRYSNFKWLSRLTKKSKKFIYITYIAHYVTYIRYVLQKDYKREIMCYLYPCKESVIISVLNINQFRN